MPKVELKPLTVHIDPGLHRAVRVKAAREERTIRDVVEEAIRALVRPNRGAA